MKGGQKINELNRAFKDIGLSSNPSEHLKYAISKEFAVDCIISIVIKNEGINAKLTYSSWHRLFSLWINEGLTSLQIEKIRMHGKDECNCSFRIESDRGLSIVLEINNI